MDGYAVENEAESLGELPSAGVTRKVLRESVHFTWVGYPLRSPSFERGEAERVGMNRGVGPPGCPLVTESDSQDVHQGVHTGDGGLRCDRVAQVHVQCRWLADEKPAESVRSLYHPGPPIVARNRGLPRLGEESVYDLVQEVVPGRYVAIKRHGGDAQAGSQSAHGEYVVTPGRDSEDSGFDDLLA